MHRTYDVFAAIASARSRLLAIATAWLPIQPAYAQTWRVQELVAQTNVVDANQQIPLQGSKSLEQARIGNLRTLLAVHNKIESIAGIRADLRIVASRSVNALAIYRPPTVVVTSAMLQVIGDDEALAAALIGHELAHISRRHGLIAAHKARQHARAGIAAAREVAVESGSISRGGLAAREVILALDSAFSRQQEIEADKVGTELLSRVCTSTVLCADSSSKILRSSSVPPVLRNTSPAQFAARMRADIRKWGRLVADAGIKADRIR